jgi:hypothetical protein
MSDPISDLLCKSYNLANDRVLQIYVAVCDDQIQQEPFWAQFKEHVRRRHRIVHSGQTASQQEAEDSIAVVDDVVQHIRLNAGSQR